METRLDGRMATEPVKEEDSAAVGGVFGEIGVTKSPEAAEREMAEAFAGNKAAVPPAFVTAGAAKKTKVVPVNVASIKALEARGPRPPTYPRGLPEHLLLCPAESLEEQEMRDSLAELAASGKALYDKEMAILEQYRKYGYAYEMFEVDDSDDEEGSTQGT